MAIQSAGPLELEKRKLILYSLIGLSLRGQTESTNNRLTESIK
jgi:hypothetical protein